MVRQINHKLHGNIIPTNVYIQIGDTFKLNAGNFNLYLYTNDQECMKMKPPYRALELALGDAIVNGDFVYDIKSNRYNQINPNVKFLQVDSRTEFTNIVLYYFNKIKKCGKSSIDLFNFTGHGWKTQIIMDYDLSQGEGKNNPENYIDKLTMAYLHDINGINIKEFNFACCYTAGKVSKNLNFAEFCAKHYKAKSKGGVGAVGPCWGTAKDKKKLQGLKSPFADSNHPLLRNWAKGIVYDYS